jgi:hypothetical protein
MRFLKSIFEQWGVLRWIVTHPLNRRRKLAAVVRWLKWHLGSRLVPGPVAVPFVECSFVQAGGRYRQPLRRPCRAQ